MKLFYAVPLSVLTLDHGETMIKIDFSKQDIAKIKRLRDSHPHPRVRKRMDVLWLKSQGLAHQEICRLTGLSSNTVRGYLKKFQDGGVEKLMELNFYAPVSELEQHRHSLEAYFREHPPATIAEAMTKIQELTGIKRSAGVVGQFLNTLALTRRRG